jgi:hypothetical protein
MNGARSRRPPNSRAVSLLCNLLDDALLLIERCEALALRAFIFGSLLYVLYQIAFGRR